MKIDMRCSEKRVSSPLGSSVYVVVLTSAIPVARVEIEVGKVDFDGIEVGQRRRVNLNDLSRDPPGGPMLDGAPAADLARARHEGVIAGLTSAKHIASREDGCEDAVTMIGAELAHAEEWHEKTHRAPKPKDGAR